MKWSNYIILGVIFCCCFMSCNQEDDIVPKGHLEMKYSVPQGTGEVDKRIEEFYKKYETMILYKYDSMDAIWNVNALVPSTYSPYRVVPIKEADVEKGVNTLFEVWLDLYPEEYLKKTLPRYIFLADSIAPKTGSLMQYYCTTQVSLTVGYMNERSINSSYTKKSIKSKLNLGYFEYCISIGEMVPSEEFVKDIPYGKITSSTYKSLGIMHYSYSNLTPQVDLEKSLEKLLSATQYTIINMFKASNDPQGNVKRRCAVLVDDMKRMYGIDLEALTGLDLPHVSEL